jgi:glycosyltransferase involved in cell wall biosynthesis
VDLGSVTPLLLTYNEEANLERTLGQLTWAERIVVVDSYSTDATLDILEQVPRAEVFQREFDAHTPQWNYGLSRVETEWVLSLDADYVLSDRLIEEMDSIEPVSSINGYRAEFTYRVFGVPLRGSLYPPRRVLFRNETARYVQDGHTQRLDLEGETAQLGGTIYHDDRKPLGRWLRSQRSYTEAELKKYRETPWSDLSWPDRLRRTKWAPLAMFAYCLLGKGLLLDGPAGWYYTFQRTYAELLLALALMDEDLRPDAGSSTSPNEPL